MKLHEVTQKSALIIGWNELSLLYDLVRWPVGSLTFRLPVCCLVGWSVSWAIKFSREGISTSLRLSEYLFCFMYLHLPVGIFFIFK